MSSKKKICIDLRVSQKSSKYTGVGIYALKLAQKLVELESDFEFWFLALKGYPLSATFPAERVIEVKRFTKPESFQELFDVFDIKRKMSKYGIKLLHATVPGMILPSKELAVIVTVHDIIPDIIPEENNGTLISKWLYKEKMKRAKKCDWIITDSLATLVDLCKHYEVPTKKVSEVYLGSQFNVENLGRLKAHTESVHDRQYLLYLGGFNFRKNVKSILLAFAKIHNEFPDVDLLIAGKPSFTQNEELKALCESLQLRERVVWLGFVKDEDLPTLYCWSNGFIYPSLYEGFGIPVLEAMQCGAPVITSDRGSIPEIIGSAGLIINPSSVIQISSAMKQLLASDKLQDQLRMKGLEQSKKFSWEKCALNTISVYEKVLKNRE